MNRGVLTVLVLSLALNLGFGLAWFSHRHVLSSRPELHERLHGAGQGQFSQGRRHANGAWAQRRAHRLHRELGLDAHQRDALRNTLEPLEPRIMDTRSELLRTRRSFAEALQVEEPAREDVMRLSHEVSRLQAQLDSLVTEALLRESAILDLHERESSGPWPAHRRGRPSPKEKR